MELINQEQIHGKYTNMQQEEIDVVYDVFTLATDPGFTEKVLKDAQKNVRVHGFREGKVPKAILEKRIGTHNLYGQSLGPIWDNFCLKNNILVGYKTELDDIQTRIDGAVVFKIVTILMPQPELIIRDQYEIDITQDIINKVAQQLQRLQQKHTTLLPVADRNTQWGDTVTIDFEGSIDANIDQDLCASGVKIEIGARQIVMPNFEENLVDMTKEQTKSFDVQIPENFAQIMPNNPRASQFAGKTATFTVTLHDIQTKQIPTDDELVIKEEKSSYAELYNELAEKEYQALANNLDDVCTRASHDILQDNEEQLTSVVQAPIIENRILSFIDRNQQHFSKMQPEQVQEYLKKNVTNLTKAVFQDVVYGCLLSQADTKAVEVSAEELDAEATKFALQQSMYSQGKVNQNDAKLQLLQTESFMLYRSAQRRKVYTILRDKINIKLNKEHDDYVAASAQHTASNDASPSSNKDTNYEQATQEA